MHLCCCAGSAGLKGQRTSGGLYFVTDPVQSKSVRSSLEMQLRASKRLSMDISGPCEVHMKAEDNSAFYSTMRRHVFDAAL